MLLKKTIHAALTSAYTNTAAGACLTARSAGTFHVRMFSLLKKKQNTSYRYKANKNEGIAHSFCFLSWTIGVPSPENALHQQCFIVHPALQPATKPVQSCSR